MTEQSKITDDKSWGEGDVSLISSDSVRFRVASHVLCWSSPVFADMLALPQQPSPPTDKTLHLTDTEFEYAHVVRLYLNLVSCQTDKLPYHQESRGYEWTTDLPSLLRFLDKYDSQNGLQLLRAYGAEKVLNRDITPAYAFVFATMMNDLALCLAVLRDFPQYSWVKTSPFQLIEGVEGGSIFSPGSAPLDFAGAIPFPYSWALSRTEKEVSLQNDPKKFCKKFYNYVIASVNATDLHPDRFAAVHRPFPPIVKQPNEPDDFDNQSDAGAQS